MKKYISMIILAMSMVSCILSENIIEPEMVEEGRPVTLHLDFVSMANDREEIMTKGGDNHDINDLYILIFSSDNGKPGTLKSKLYTTDLKKSDVKIPNDKGLSGGSTSTRVTTPIETTTGESFIFAFANITSASAPAEYMVESLKSELDGLETGTNCFDELMNVTVSLKDKEFTSLQRVTDLYLMAGTYQKTGQYTRAFTPCVIDDSGTLSDGTVRMYRLDAKIDFRIISDTSDESKGTFVPTAWRLYNVPLKSRLMTTEYGTGEDFDGKSPIYTTDAGVAENYWNTDRMKIDAQGSEYVFSFYMFENRKAPSAAAEEISQWEYRHRETMNPLMNTDGTTSTEGNLHSFKYAPKYATYIEIDGYFTGTTEYPFGSDEKDGSEHQITATTQYRIHLGDFGSNVGGRTYDDFNTLRNYHYTYTITVKGVEQIVVEVNKDPEDLDDMDTPGINGIVSYLPSNNHRVDSHFETRSIRIKKSDLANWTEEDFRYLAQTCYGDYEGPKGTGSPRQDIYWIEFILTHKQGKNGGWYGWYTNDEKKETSYSGTDFKTSGKFGPKHPAYMSYYHAKLRKSQNEREGKLMYVHEFLQDLWEWKNAPEDETDNVHYNIQEKIYTVFIKENYYSNEDIQKFERKKNNLGTGDENHWKDFCNQPDRVMYIGMNKIESGETESTTMENVCVARQRSIQTIYNTDHKHTGLTSAWGIETVDEMRSTLTKFDVYQGETRTEKDAAGANEDFVKDFANNSIYFNADNGYVAQYYFLWAGWRMYTTGTAAEKPETLWKTYINLRTHDAMTAGKYYHAYFECLTRNKDVDGDGFIDPGEIRWYLPALNQLGDIFIGERGIEPEATLYYGQNEWNHDYQYLVSTIRNESGNYSQYKVLAEEGFAYNTSDDRPLYNLRCVRNLGVNGDINYSEGFYDKSSVGNSKNLLLSTYQPPQQYVQVDETTRTMDLTYLNDDSKRGFVNTELSAEHTERSDENQLYDKFQWADGLVTASHKDPNKDSYQMFSGDEVAYGERKNSSMRTLTRAYLYPNDKKNVVQTADESPKQGWRAPNQKELMLLHFHANGFRNGTSHTCTQADGKNDNGDNHSGFSGTNWFFCRTVFSYSGVKANRSGRDWTSNWVLDATFVNTPDLGGISTTQNDGNYYRVDKNNECPSADPTSYANYRYAFGIQHNGTGFGLLFLDWYLQGNTNTRNCLLVPVRDVR